MFGFLKSKRAEVMEHWIAFVEGFQFSSSEFYDSVESELKVRERLVFDVCAAPFGRSFFFSCRFAEVPPVIKLWQLILVLVSFAAIVVFAWRAAGLILGTLLLLAALALLIYTLRNAVAMGLRDLDATLIKSPIVGPIYELFFRKETYYRHDTRLMYLEVVSGVVKRLAEDAVAAKGLKLIKQYEQAPILGELYKPVIPRSEPVK